MRIKQPAAGARRAGHGAGLVGTSRAFLAAVSLAERVADTTANVLITGESGTGKEVIARSIHQRSARKDKAFVAINCAALPESLLEAELFGIDRGVATGVDARAGTFERADGGTLFLDEIGDMAATTQARVLRVLQERQVVARRRAQADRGRCSHRRGDPPRSACRDQGGPLPGRPLLPSQGRDDSSPAAAGAPRRPRPAGDALHRAVRARHGRPERPLSRRPREPCWHIAGPATFASSSMPSSRLC
jgi:hypothetical protein